MTETAIELLRTIIIVGMITAGVLAILIWKKNQTRRLSYLRVFFQVAAVVIIFLGLVIGPFGLVHLEYLGTAPRNSLFVNDLAGVPIPDGLSVPVLACYYPSGRTVTCPIWQIQSYLFPFWEIGGGWDVFYSTPGIVRLAVVVGLVVGMSIVLGRFFCGWLCPFGLYMDLLTRLRSTLKIRYWNLSDRLNRILSQSRFIIIAAFLVLSVILGAEAIFGQQLIGGTQRGEYLFDYFSAPFCEVCPMRPLSVLIEGALGYMRLDYVFSQTAGMFYEAGYYVSSLNISILFVITALSFMVRRFWCRICPLGGMISVFSVYPPFKWVAGVTINKVEEKCTKCGICKRVCPTQVNKVYDEKGGDVTATDCILCFRCVEMCPYEECLNIAFARKPIYNSRNWLDEPKIK
ncbi:MAG: 4Fe-4S binding protein [Candidatus Bathyarchaeia archaeon]|jgi:ferredoxin